MRLLQLLFVSLQNIKISSAKSERINCRIAFPRYDSQSICHERLRRQVPSYSAVNSLHLYSMIPMRVKRLLPSSFLTRTNAGAEQEYEKRHSPIWAELELVLKQHGKVQGHA
jgi:hypothetical protein